MFKIEDDSIKNSGNPQRFKYIIFNELNGYFYAEIARETPKGERAVQLSRQTRSPQRSKAPAPLDEAFSAPATPILRSAAVRAAANQSCVTTQRAVEDYILRLI